MEKNNQNHEEYPICFLSDFVGAGNLTLLQRHSMEIKVNMAYRRTLF